MASTFSAPRARSRVLGFMLAGALLGLEGCGDDDGSASSEQSAGGRAGAAAEVTGGAPSGGAVSTGGVTEPVAGRSNCGGANGGACKGGASGEAGEPIDHAAGSDAGGAGGGDETGGETADFPELLSETGLYEDIAGDQLAASALAYHPAFELWSDGADKRRWVLLPDGAQIDTSEMDYWKYPVGTQFFKEFSVGGRRIETRLLRKLDWGWTAVAYLWNEDGSDATAAPDGVSNALGTEHDVPEQKGCVECHENVPDYALGFSALQLSHDEDGVTLSSLVQEQRLSTAPAAPLVIPGNDTTRAALGYLHANCGNCHNERSFIMAHAAFSLWLTVNTLDSLEETSAYVTAVDQRAQLMGEHSLLVAPGLPDESELLARMKQRGTEDQMPPLASELPDDAGIAIVSSWIENVWEE